MKKIDSYFKKRTKDDTPTIETPPLNDNEDNTDSSLQDNQVPNLESSPAKIQKIDQSSCGFHIERDPGLRKSIWDYPSDKRDETRRAYLLAGPYQCIPEKSSKCVDKHGRRFLPSWYQLFPDWLEYSPSKDAAFCLPCFLFAKPSAHFGANAFTVDGFRSWKKVNGKNCSFLVHEGNSPNSQHRKAVEYSHNLMNSLQQIEKIMVRQSLEIAKNRLRLKVSLDVAKFCAFQGIAFRSRNECADSPNRGNFLELIKHTSSYNEEVALTVLENAPHNASYISPTIQKEILTLYASRIQRFIRDEIGDAKYCLIVDESRDESKREQMTIVLRFVDKDSFVKERFFDIVHVEDTKASTLKTKISSVLYRNGLLIQNIRGQGYDGASNMRGEWNGLQALFLDECPYAYYVHCFTHRLHLVLVATAQSSMPVENFFSHLLVIINLVDSSSKRHDQLQIAQAIRIADFSSRNELETGRGKNQIGAIQCPGDTRWGSHLRSLLNLLDMFDSVLLVLSEIINDKSGSVPRAAADGAYDIMTSFEFVFVLHFMIELLEIADDLCRILQGKSQDIVNAMDAVLNTKELLQKFRWNGWDDLFGKVKIFCEKHEIDIPDMNAPHKAGRGHACRGDPITLEHHFRIDIFTTTIDSILQEMNHRFNESTTDLLRLSSALDPRDGYKSFNINDICTLVEKFYPDDFTDQEKLHIKYQLQLFELDILHNLHFQNLSTVSDLCRVLSKTGKRVDYYLVDRLIRLILTLPVSTATTERAFSSMKVVKTRLRNKMEDEFLAGSLLMKIEKKIAQSFDTDSIIDEFML